MRSAPPGPDTLLPGISPNMRTFLTKAFRKHGWDHTEQTQPSVTDLYPDFTAVWNVSCVLMSVLVIDARAFDECPDSNGTLVPERRYRVIASNLRGEPLSISCSCVSLQLAYNNIVSHNLYATSTRKSPFFLGSAELQGISDRLMTAAGPGITPEQAAVINHLHAPLARLTTRLVRDFRAVCFPPRGFGTEGHHHLAIRGLTMVISALQVVFEQQQVPQAQPSRRRR
jgi:hypothetical protein